MPEHRRSALLVRPTGAGPTVPVALGHSRHVRAALLCIAALLLAPQRDLAPQASRASSARSDTVVRMAGRPVHPGVASLRQEMSIGVPNGAEEYLFADVADVAVAKDGAIYVFDRGTPAIRKYDAAGKYVRTLGRKGRGPGEYLSGSGLGVLPDGRVLLWDTGNWRVNVYSATGDVLTSWSTESGMGPNSSMSVARGLPDRYPFELHVPAAPARRGVPATWQPGQPVVSVRREAEAEAEPVTGAEWAQARSDLEERLRTTDPRWSWGLSAAPKTKPFYKALLVGEDGRIWVELVKPTIPAIGMLTGGGGVGPAPARLAPSTGKPKVERAGLYDVFEPNGTYVGRVQLPLRVSLAVMRGEFVWGVAFDDDDVQSVKRYAISWPTAR